jgi:hypothetical protein
MSTGMYMSNMGMHHPIMGSQAIDKGKGKIRQEDFETAFAEVAASMHQTETARMDVVSEDRFTGLENAMMHTSLESKAEEAASITHAELPANAGSQEKSDFNKCAFPSACIVMTLIAFLQKGLEPVAKIGHSSPARRYSEMGSRIQ